MAFCLTEPLAGSDVGSMQTTAMKEGNQYLLNGKKNFVTNGKEFLEKYGMGRDWSEFL
jgi:butyryl-CoA dehydrogenase